MDSKVSYALVGLFVILLGGAWLAISVWLSVGDFQASYRSYQVYMNESVTGLHLDAAVTYRGVEVGRVKSIALNPDNLQQVILILDIDDSVPVREDTVAILASQGVTGIAFINLEGGSADAPLLQARPGEAYPRLRSGPSLFVRLDTAISELLPNLNSVAAAFGELADEPTRASFKSTMANLEQVSATLAEHRTDLAGSLSNAAFLLEQGVQISRHMPALMEQLARSGAAVEDMAQRMAATGEQMGGTVSDTGAEVQRFSQQTLPEINRLLGDLRELSASLQRLGRRLEEDPRVMIYGPQLDTPGPGE